MPQHSRQASNGRKSLQPLARPVKPSLSAKRGSSYTQLNASSRCQAHGHHHRPGSSGGNRQEGSDEQQPDDGEASGMASFLQYCATCERQIVTPGSNILYCSEACRRKDIGLPTPVLASPSSPLINAMPSYFEHYPNTDIIPQRSPTVPRPMSLTFYDLVLPDMITGDHYDSSSSDSLSRRDSDSAKYLSQYYTEASSAQLSNSRRHRINRNAGVDSNLPSLVHSPSSSYGTVASNASLRALPSRQNPFTNAFSTSKSIELVIPAVLTPMPSSPGSPLRNGSMKSCASTMTSYRVAEAGGMSYQQRPASEGEARQMDDRLRQLHRRESAKSENAVRR